MEDFSIDFKEKNFKQLLVFVSILTFIFSAFNIFIGLPIGLTVSAFSFSIISISFYLYLLKNPLTQVIIFTYTILVLITIFITSYFNSGIEGPLIMFLPLILFISNLFLNNKTSFYLLIFLSISSLIVFYDFYTHPEKISFYTNREDKFIDIGFSAILSFVLSYFFTRFYKKESQLYLNKLIEAKEIVNDQKIKLSKLNDQKNTIFATIFHDLRTPIGNTISLFDYIKNIKSLTAEEKILLSKTSSQINNTLQLIDNLLIWARSQMDNSTVNLSHFDSQQEIVSIISTFKLNIEEKNIKVNYTRKQIPKVYADREHFGIICRNLLSNAIKFTPSFGNINIEAAVHENNYILFSISDSGIGMDESLLPKLFTVFSSTLGTNKEKGTGIGLNISKHFIDINRGIIWAENIPNSGLKVSFILPINPS